MMTTTQQDKPGGKPRQRSRKADQRRPKGEQRSKPAGDPRNEDQVRPIIASDEAQAIEVLAEAPAMEAVVEASAMEAVSDAPAFETATDVPLVQAVADVPPIDTPAKAEAPLVGEVLPPVTRSTGMAEAAEIISLQTIANAYADYAKASLHESRSYVEKFMAVRSFDKAIELQSEFARQAYANFVAESLKICGLYGRWARQIFRPWEAASVKLTGARP
jgi:Phasin protein